MTEAVTASAFYFSEAMLLPKEEGPSGISHDAILNTLDREANGLYLALEAFAPSVPQWNNVPIIFARGHPDTTLYDVDPIAALKAVEGHVVGYLANPILNMTGHPTLRGTLVITNMESTIEPLIRAGKMSLSTCFICAEDKKAKRIVGFITPHHILLFIEVGSTIPGDRGSVILNQSHGVNTMPSLKERLIAAIVAIFAKEPVENQAPPAPAPPAPAPPARVNVDATEIATFKADLAKAQDEAKKFMDEAASATKHVAELEAKIVTFLMAEADRKWAEVKMHLPPGMVTPAEKEAATRAEWTSDPQGFAVRILALKDAQDPPAGGQQGEQHVPPVNPDAPRKNALEWDAVTQKFKD